MFKTKAFLCLVLCMCLCTFFIPNALGASQYPLWQPPEPIVDKTPREGKCGENVTWKLDEKGIFTLSGTGAMETYYGNTAPWNSLRLDIKKVVLGGGVTTSVGTNGSRPINHNAVFFSAASPNIQG